MACRPQAARTPPCPQDDQSADEDRVRRGVEQAVLKGIHLEALEGGRRIVALGREHVMPLENLVKDDPIEEPAEADAQKEGRQDDAAHRWMGAVGRSANRIWLHAYLTTAGWWFQTKEQNDRRLLIRWPHQPATVFPLLSHLRESSLRAPGNQVVDQGGLVLSRSAQATALSRGRPCRRVERRAAPR